MADFSGFGWCCCGGCDFSDDFSTVKSGYTKRDTANGNPSSAPNIFVSGGRLYCEFTGTLASERGSYTRDIAFPASGNEIQVSAKVYSDPAYVGGDGIPDYNANGVIVGGGGNRAVINPRWQFGDTICTVISGGTVVFQQTFAGTPGSGGTLMINAGWSGIWRFRFFRNGVLLASAAPFSTPTLPNPIPVGVACSGGGQWDDLCIDEGDDL